MFNSKYGSVLTVLLVIVIVAIVAIIGYFGYEIVSEKSKEKASDSIVEQFDTAHPTISTADDSSSDGNNAEGNVVGIGEGKDQDSSSSSKRGNSSKKIVMAGSEVIGTIRIPAISLKQPILDDVTKKSLETAVAKLYTTNGLNQPGNTVVIGHNYRNNLFFSKNDKLKKGDVIYIKDKTGVEKKYKINEKFEAKSSDASFYKADNSGKTTLILSTCTDDASKTDKRLIIKADEVK